MCAPDATCGSNVAANAAAGADDERVEWPTAQPAKPTANSNATVRSPIAAPAICVPMEGQRRITRAYASTAATLSVFLHEFRRGDPQPLLDVRLHARNRPWRNVAGADPRRELALRR